MLNLIWKNYLVLKIKYTMEYQNKKTSIKDNKIA